MKTFEFNATIENGMIKIPHKYQSELNKHVHVIVVSKDIIKKKPNFIDQLIENPKELNDFTPLKRDDIYDRDQ